ncbi:uncharacterized protein SOCG_04551 [Schizosaccharomyces octosporus yFS286]|uniref:SUN domain-containing protein n=1 Tax=Schizosaccharomyces octosporus (strain yFS286) TaxID=483514 RepID=S9Q6P0_SCHOY|nr:uncharacterized protein SOCG_04551 [Schizosaccharomyces octosporus yFS286]EPX75308.1 hypothetical protein SOCG_04551 [Schizosaccharomyces octosporus yFS286]
MTETSMPSSGITEHVLNGGYVRARNYLRDDASNLSNGATKNASIRSHTQNGRTAKRRTKGMKREHRMNNNLFRNAFFYCIYFLRLLGWMLWRSYLVSRYLVIYHKGITFTVILFLMLPFLLLTQDYEAIRLRIIHWVIDYARRFAAIWKPVPQAPNSTFSKEPVNISHSVYADYPKLHQLLCTAISFPFLLQPFDTLIKSFTGLYNKSNDLRFEDLSEMYTVIVLNTRALEHNQNLLCAMDVLNLENPDSSSLKANTQALYQKVNSLHHCTRMVNDMALYVNYIEPYNMLYHAIVLKDLQVEFLPIIFNYTCLLQDISSIQNVLLDLVYPKGIAAMEREIKNVSTTLKENNETKHFENPPFVTTDFVSHDALTNLTKELEDARKDILQNFVSISLNNSFEQLRDLSKSYSQQTLNRLKSSIASQPNFALKAVGACIDYAWTFPKPSISELFKEYWKKSTNVPAVLLHDNISGSWCSTGSLVQFAIEVSRPIYISQISLLQPVHGDDSKFPEKLRIFGLLDKHTNANDTLRNQESLLLLGEIPIPPMLSTIATVFQVSDYSENPELISRLYYKSFVIQATSSKELSDSLCLYHIGVHGKEAFL